MQALRDFLRNIEWTYSRLADDMTEYLFRAAGWFGSGSTVEIATRAALIIVAVAAVHFALGGSKAMGDKKKSGLPLWLGIALVFAAGIAVAFVLM